MRLDLNRLRSSDENIYIILNPKNPPFTIHSKSPYWDTSSVKKLLEGYRIFRRLDGGYLETSEPVIIVCGRGLSIYTPGRAVDKVRGGVLTYTLVKTMFGGSLDGYGLGSVEVSIQGFNNEFLRMLISSLKPLVFVSGFDEAKDFLRGMGFKIIFPEELYTRDRLRQYLMDRYGISIDGGISSSRKLEAIYGGLSLSLCIDMYRWDCDLAVLEDTSMLKGISHISLYPPWDHLSINLFI